MRKFLLLFLLAFSFGYSQIKCEQQFTASGWDVDPTQLIIYASELTCNNGEINSIKIKSAKFFEEETDSEFCGLYYGMTMNLDGENLNVCPADLINYDITNFGELSFTSNNPNIWLDHIDMVITIEIDYNTTEIPSCDSNLITPIPGTLFASNSGFLKWSAATNASGYYIKLGTTEGGTEILNNLDVGNTTNYTTQQALDDNTMYYLTITPYNLNGISQDICTEYSFTTCGNYELIDESFNISNDDELPNCWKVINESIGTMGHVKVIDSKLHILNSFNIEQFIGAVSPQITNLSENTHRLKFKAYSENYTETLIVGVVTNPDDSNTFQTVAELTLSEDLTNYYIDFSEVNAGSNIVFKHGLSAYYTNIVIDDVVWEEIPSEIPACVDGFNVNLDVCGNYSTRVTWEPTQGAEGYRVSLGDSELNLTLINELNIGENNFFEFTGEYNQQYFFKVTPYNILGDAEDCIIASFTTADNGCHCVSIPENYDGMGVMSITVGGNEYNTVNNSYTDLSIEEIPVPFFRNTINLMEIKFHTGQTYDTNIWIDLNDNFIFEEEELIYSGESNNMLPAYLYPTYLVPADANLGEHRMRIATADYEQEIPNPCYNGIYGVTIDIIISIEEEPSCGTINETTATDITSNSASLFWTNNTPETSVMIQVGVEGFEIGTDTINFENITQDFIILEDLESNTKYEYYISKDCGNDFSPWTGPFKFKTFCGEYDSFTEDFSVANEMELPDCWSRIIINGGEYAYAGLLDWFEKFEMTNFENEDATIMLVSPILTDLTLGTHRAKFKLHGYEPTPVLVGTMSDPNDHTTFTLIETLNITDQEIEYKVNFNFETTDRFIAIKHDGTPYMTFYIDDFIWEPIPTAIPGCIDDIAINIDQNCGNFATELIWEPVPGADNYLFFAGTASENYDYVNGINIGNTSTYNFEADYGTTYYIKVVPVNHFGTAIDCTQFQFATVTQGCYCISEPEYVNGEGITEVLFADTLIEPTGNTYTDFTNGGITEIELGSTVDFSINLTTNLYGTYGFPYDINIWIDYNDDFKFDETEKVFSSIAESVSPTTLSNSLIVSDNISHLGIHRIRISAAEENSINPDPCYNSYSGETLDFLVNITPSLSKESILVEGLKVYPNPSKSIVTISAKETIQQIEIFNLLGQKVLSKETNSNTNQIDISRLPIGTYLLKVQANDRTETVKIIKQ